MSVSFFLQQFHTLEVIDQIQRKVWVDQTPRLRLKVGGTPKLQLDLDQQV